VENVEVVREAGGIITGVEHDAPGEVTLLAPVASEDL
jgi:hypothetical protein